MSEFFVGRQGDLKTRDPLQPGSASFPAIEASGVTPEFLADLEGLVMGKKKPKASKEVAAGGDEGPWLNVLSDAFVKRLATLGSEECDEFTAKWLRQSSGTRGPSPIVSDLAALCRLATRANETRGYKPKSPDAWHVYLWTGM